MNRMRLVAVLVLIGLVGAGASADRLPPYPALNESLAAVGRWCSAAGGTLKTHTPTKGVMISECKTSSVAMLAAAAEDTGYKIYKMSLYWPALQDEIDWNKSRLRREGFQGPFDCSSNDRVCESFQQTTRRDGYVIHDMFKITRAPKAEDGVIEHTTEIERE